MLSSTYMSALAELYKEITRCRNCKLAETRNTVVPGEGPEDASLFFIGEAPGWNEDQQGRPFIGQAGAFLEHLLGLINLTRDQVYIANVIKCRPPENRDPLLSEIQSCQKWLDLQIEIVKPKMIITLGRYSLARYFPGESIGKTHGKARVQDGIIYYPMYHPAAALHQNKLRKTIEMDMLEIPGLLTQTEKTTEVPAEVQQLNLF
jgi:uracil-DNA glycosylase family 4